jgi:hypothetical protein
MKPDGDLLSITIVSGGDPKKPIRPCSQGARVLGTLTRHPRATVGGLATLLPFDEPNLAAMLGYLCARGRVIRLGTLGQARAAGIDVLFGVRPRDHQKIYALPGTPLLPPLFPPSARGPQPGAGIPARARGAKSRSIAGRITIGRGSFWGAGLV